MLLVQVVVTISLTTDAGRTQRVEERATGIVDSADPAAVLRAGKLLADFAVTTGLRSFPPGATSAATSPPPADESASRR